MSEILEENRIEKYLILGTKTFLKLLLKEQEFLQQEGTDEDFKQDFKLDFQTVKVARVTSDAT